MLGIFFVFFFFFKQKTAYEMRISDWSSDVCSSDLRAVQPLADAAVLDAQPRMVPLADGMRRTQRRHRNVIERTGAMRRDLAVGMPLLVDHLHQIGRASCRERVCQYV